MRMRWFLISQTTAMAALAVAGYAVVLARQDRAVTLDRIELAGPKGHSVALDADGLTFRAKDGTAKLDADGIRITDIDGTRHGTMTATGIALTTPDGAAASLAPGGLVLEGFGGSIIANTTRDAASIDASAMERTTIGQGITSVSLRVDQKTAAVLTSRLPSAGGKLSAHLGVFDDTASVDVRANAAAKSLEVGRP
jgi:hypothetical protein